MELLDFIVGNVPPLPQQRLNARFADCISVSIIYLTIAQATALNFLAPMGAMLMSRYFDHGTFSLADRVGAVVAPTGVVLVVQPDIIFQSTEAPTGITSRSSHETPKQLKGVVCGLIGVAGGVVSPYTDRHHLRPLSTRLINIVSF